MVETALAETGAAVDVKFVDIRAGAWPHPGPWSVLTINVDNLAHRLLVCLIVRRFKARRLLIPEPNVIATAYQPAQKRIRTNECAWDKLFNRPKL
jgi:hypothetical protein